jgi:hypothetical protein
MDTQTIELLGRHRLANELLRAGLEVASPLRDRGVDLIAYADIDKQVGRFVAKPIQMKAASQRSFGIWRKYHKIHDLIFAFVWDLDDKAGETYALTSDEAIAVGTAMGWTKTPSWLEDGGYSTTKPGAKLCELLEQYRMTPDRWWGKVVGSSKERAVEQGDEADER